MKSKTGWMIAAVLVFVLMVTLPFAEGRPGSPLATTPAYADEAMSSAPGAAPVAVAAPAVGQHTITVNGQGEIEIEPDVAYINLGVQSDGATAEAAQSANAQVFAKLTAALKGDGVADAEIKTTNFSVQPQYQYANNEKPKLTGYQASHNIQVTYRKMDTIGKLLDDASAAGANTVNGVQFGTEKQHDYELQALTKAMENAKAKADVLAKSAGGSVKAVLNITENGSSAPPRVYADYSFAAEKSLAGAASTPISSGQLTITTSVTVQYVF